MTVRQLDVAHRRAKLGEDAHALVERRAHVRIDAAREHARRHADPQALQVAAEHSAENFGTARAAAVASRGSAPLIDLETERGILDRSRERPDLIERRGERDEPEARDAAVGRLHPDDAAERGRLANRSAGVRSERDRRHARRHRDRRSAARSARRPVERPRVADGPNAEFSVDDPIANSSQMVLPTMTAPACSSRSITVASNGEHVVFEHLRSGGRRRARAPRCCP